MRNHPFLDGNKRTGYAAMRVFIDANGYELTGETDEKERVILAVAAGEIEREEFVEWVRNHVRPRAQTETKP